MSVIIISCLVTGCLTQLKSLRRGVNQAKTSQDTGVVAKPGQPGNAATSGEKSSDELAPVYAPPPPPPSKESAARTSFDLRLKDEIAQSALEFAKNYPEAKHVKICYSKLFGGWYLFLYIQEKKEKKKKEKDKNISIYHYEWRPKTSEWEIITTFRDELREDEVKFHLQGELADETCEVLK